MFKILPFLSCLFGLSALSSFAPTLSSQNESQNIIDISGIQLRGNEAASEYYFVINSDLYFEASVNYVSKTTTYNTLSNITIYTSENDTGTLLSSVASNSWVINKWGSAGVMFQIPANKYDQFNGSTVYKVSINQGTELPVNDVKYVTEEDYVFINNDYGVASAKYEAFSWTKVQQKKDEDASIYGVQLRGDAPNNELFFVINEKKYGSFKPDSLVNNPSNYNVLDKVLLYLSKDSDPVYLKDITTGDWRINKWGSEGVMFPISVSDYEIYNGSTVYMVTILKGTTLPYENAKLTVQEDISFKNNNYGNNSAKYEAFNWSLCQVYEKSPVDNTTIEIRGDYPASEYYLDIKDPRYLDIEPDTKVSNVDEFNCLSHIKFYLNDEDEGVFLSEIVTNDLWTMNKWSSSSIMFRIDSNCYETYNGASVYKVELLEGLEIPCGRLLLTFDETITWYNKEYQDDSVKYESFYWTTVEPHERSIIDTSINGVQVRSGGTDENYLVLQAMEYLNIPIGLISEGIDQLNFLNNITIYLSKDDKGILLKEIYNGVTVENKWLSSGVMFGITNEAYETYNGKTVYAVEINKGCEMPCNGDTLVMSSGSFYINNDYGKDSAINEAFNFIKSFNTIEDMGTVNVTRIQNRAGFEARYFCIDIDSIIDSYTQISTLLEKLNTLDNILIYETPNSNPYPIRDIYDGLTILREFNEETMVCLRLKNENQYSGVHMFRVMFLEGCQIPYVHNGAFGYKTITSVTSFINGDYGKSGNIFGLYDEEGFPRTYDNWSVNWNKAYQISFVVEGLDVSYESLYAPSTNYIDLTGYEVDGYTLTIETINHEKVYQGYFVGDSNMTLILKYSKNTNTGCNGSISPICALIMLLSIGMYFVIRRRKMYE